MSSQPNKSLIDGLACLQALAMQPEPVACRALARELDLNVMRANRLLRTLADVGLAHQRVESLHVGGKVVVRVRRPWERESVENFKLNVERANRVVSHDQEERPQDATVPTPPHSPMEGGGGVPSCSLGRDIVDKVIRFESFRGAKVPR